MKLNAPVSNPQNSPCFGRVLSTGFYLSKEVRTLGRGSNQFHKLVSLASPYEFVAQCVMLLWSNLTSLNTKCHTLPESQHWVCAVWFGRSVIPLVEFSLFANQSILFEPIMFHTSLLLSPPMTKPSSIKMALKVFPSKNVHGACHCESAWSMREVLKLKWLWSVFFSTTNSVNFFFVASSFAGVLGGVWRERQERTWALDREARNRNGFNYLLSTHWGNFLGSRWANVDGNYFKHFGFRKKWNRWLKLSARNELE